MSLKTLAEGEYDAQLTNWELQFNQYLNKPQVCLTFDVKTPDGFETIRYTGLLFTKSGEPNKKTMQVLETIELDGNVEELGEFGGPSVNNTKGYSLTLLRNDKGYLNVEWVNDPAAPKKEGAGMPAKATKDDLKKFDFSAFRKAAKPADQPQPKALDADEPLPF